jgi:transcriptional regulator GlxA family with amidase domain
MTARQYQSLLEHVEAHLSASLSLADLAAASTLTVAHLSRALKRATGETPSADCSGGVLIMQSSYSYETMAR